MAYLYQVISGTPDPRSEKVGLISLCLIKGSRQQDEISHPEACYDEHRRGGIPTRLTGKEMTRGSTPTLT